MREEGRKIYYTGSFFADENECLLYDFNAQVGDTIKHYSDGGMKSIVLAVDSILIDGNYRKKYTVEDKSGGTGIEPDCIIEGIGSVKHGLLLNIMPIPTCSCFNYWEHICFEENGIVKYLNPAFSGCSSTQRLAGIHEIPSEKQRNIEISAVEGVLSLHSTTQDIRSIKLVTPNGSLLFEDNSVRESSYKKQLNYRGVLFCIIGFENGEVSTEKILVK